MNHIEDGNSAREMTRASSPASEGRPSVETLQVLKEALQKATGPSEELNLMIAQWLGWRSEKDVYDPRITYWSDPDGNIGDLPDWVGSIDAAMTLVPKNWHLHCAAEKYGKASVCLHHAFGSHEADEVIWRKGHSWPSQYMISATARTLPLAYCLARVEYEIAKADGKSPAPQASAERQE